jgi:hypothetical protein
MSCTECKRLKAALGFAIQNLSQAQRAFGSEVIATFASLQSRRIGAEVALQKAQFALTAHEATHQPQKTES